MALTDIGSSLELEGKKVEEYSKRFNDISSDVTNLAKKKEYLNSFASLTQDICGTVNETIHTRVKNILVLKDSYPDLSARKISDLKTLLRRLHFIIKSQYVSYEKIPRNLYRLIDFFLDRCNTNINYIISFGESVSVNPFNQLLRYYGAGKTYPELFDKIEKAPEQVFFIYIPPEFADERSSLLWPAVIHEVVHAIDQKGGIVHDFFKDISPSYIEIHKSATEFLDEYSMQKLWATEFIADYLATWAIGPYYPKILLDEYFSIGSLLGSHKTHPPLDQRAEKLLELIQKAKFKEEGKIINEKLEKQKGGFYVQSPPTKVENLEKIYKKIEKNFSCAQFNHDEYAESIRTNFPEHDVSTLKEDFKNKKSVLLDPPSLLTLLTSIDGIEKDQKLNELFSDYMQLYLIKKEFNKKCI